MQTEGNPELREQKQIRSDKNRLSRIQNRVSEKQLKQTKLDPSHAVNMYSCLKLNSDADTSYTQFKPHHTHAEVQQLGAVDKLFSLDTSVMCDVVPAPSAT